MSIQLSKEDQKDPQFFSAEKTKKIINNIKQALILNEEDSTQSLNL